MRMEGECLVNDQTAEGEIAAEQKHGVQWQRIGFALVLVLVVLIITWVGMEWRTVDGQEVWSPPVIALAAIAAVIGGVGGMWFGPPWHRRWRKVVDHHSGWPLPMLIGSGIAITVVVGGFVAHWQAELLTAPGRAVWSTLNGGQLLDVARSTAFALGALGGVGALLVAYRKQKSTEDSHKHEVEKEAAARIADMHDRYTKAVEQLAHDKPAVRLGGVYALAALANDWAAVDNDRQRQTCVDLLCAYIRAAAQPMDEHFMFTVSEEIGTPYKQLEEENNENLQSLYEDRDVRRAILDVLSELVSGAVKDSVAPTVDIEGMTFQAIDMQKVRLAHLSLAGTDVMDRRLVGANFAGADLRDVNVARSLTRVRLMDANIEGVDLTHATLHDVEMTRASMRRVILSNASLENVTLIGADLTGANLAGIRLSQLVSLEGADLTGANVVNVDLTRASLGGTKLNRAVIAAGCWTVYAVLRCPMDWPKELRFDAVPEFTRIGPYTSSQ